MIMTLTYISGLLTPLNTTALAEQDSVAEESMVTHHVHLWTKGF